jgi:MarR family transcriptional regulator, organic hydroperoxide resistance regulator
MEQAKRDEYMRAIDGLFHDIFRRLRPPTPPAGEMNITLGQMHCLGTIAQLGHPTMSHVAETLNLHPSTVTVLVDGLVAHGLVTRTPDPRDRRIVRVSETSKGRRNHKRHIALMQQRIGDMLAPISDKELTKVIDGLTILREAASRYSEQAASPEAAARKPRRL